MIVVLAVAGVFAGFWFAILAPKRADSAAVKDQIAQAEARRDAAVTAAATSEQARATYQRDRATLARLGKAVPADDDVASLVYQLERVASTNKVDFRAAKLSAAGAAPVAAPPATPKDGDAATSKDEETATDTTSPQPPAVSQAPPGAVVGAAGLLTLPFTFTFDGGYLPTQRMLGAIDRLADITDGGISVRGRLLTVDGFAMTKGRSGYPKIKALVSATAYIVPEAAAPVAATPGSASDPVDTTASIQGIQP
ncbi:MAG TPA: hypothetical protein VMY78_05800 [Solirubrobacteraceae bacterium]|nr:hypothetical protein [Solirubrobacteraceae bacterium]